MAKGKGNGEQLAPIIIKKVKKGGHAHHGGSWKVAFADFATAMMAFFLLMWLLESTTEEQKGAISEYFNNPSAVPGTSTVPSPTSVQGPGGASTSMIDHGGGMELHTDSADEDGLPKQDDALAEEDEAEKRAEELDRERLNSLLEQLEEAIDAREALAKFKEQILLDITPEGVRIQIVDHERRSMFPLGSARLEIFSANILFELANIIKTVPNRISISGHTDIKPYFANNYSNWELSADRANAARRALIQGSLPPEKVGRVVGLASSVLLDSAVPDSPINRRISIIVMNRRTEEAILHENGSLLSVQSGSSDATVGAQGSTEVAETAAPIAEIAAPVSEPVAAITAP
jgi:chemotaxis protein MotB